MKRLTILLLLCTTIASSQTSRKTRFYVQTGLDPAIAVNLKKSDGTERPGGGTLNYVLKGGVEFPLEKIYWGASLEVEGFEALNFFAIGGRIEVIVPLFKNIEGISGLEMTQITRTKPDGARATSYDEYDAISIGVNAALRYTFKRRVFIELNGNFATSPDEHHYFHNYDDPMTYRYSNTLSIGLLF